MAVKSIVSGGQTGADQGSLFAAEQLGLTTAGYAPKYYRTEGGNAIWLGERFGLIEHASSEYPARTKANVSISDGTAIFGRRSPGSNATEEFCRVLEKPCIWVWWPQCSICQLIQLQTPSGLACTHGHGGADSLEPNPKRLTLWLRRNNISILNCAGNRESKNPGIGDFTKSYLIGALS